jgi:hypothetical protein
MSNQILLAAVAVVDSDIALLLPGYLLGETAGGRGVSHD